MRIGHISTEYKPIRGGAETYLANLYQIFTKQSWEQHVYQFNNGIYDPELKLLPRLPSFLRAGRALDLWWFNLMLPLRIIDLRKEDLLVCHYAFHSLPLWWKKKVVVLSHGCEWDIPPTSTSQRLKVKIAQWSFDHFKYLVANDTNYFRQMGVDIKPKTKLFEEVLPGKWFIPNCVDTEIFKPGAAAEGFPEHMILVPRNISHARGVHLAIEAFSQFVKLFPETTLVVVGAFFGQAYQQKVFRLIKRFELQKKVIFKGSLPWEQMPAVYNAAEMTVIPTLQREGTSLAALESMSCGTATVSTNAQGLADLPTQQSDPEPKALTGLMGTTYHNRQRIGQEQREIVRRDYNLGRWQQAWRTVINNAKNAPS